jgi:ribosomal protein L28
MAKRCDITGRGTQTGNTRSHSMRAGKRKFKVNLTKKKVQLPDGSQVTIKINSRLYKKVKGFIN